MTDQVPEVGLELARALVDVSPDQVSHLVLFGSRLVQASPSAHSAYDFVVVVRSSRAFYQDFVEASGHRRPAWLLSLLGRVMPPNVISYTPSGLEEDEAKCLVLTERALRRALGPRPPDHFIKGRMSQKVAIVYARSPESRKELDAMLHRARSSVFWWAGPYLDEPFTARSLTLQMLEISYRGEIRPESGDRVREVWESQEEWFARVYGRILEEAEARGEVVRVPEGWHLASPPGFWHSFLVRVYFLRSKARATLRWAKYVLTYDDWLSYIQKKVERRTGMTVELTKWERKLPLLLLWPKVFRVLKNRPHRQPENGEDD